MSSFFSRRGYSIKKNSLKSTSIIPPLDYNIEEMQKIQKEPSEETVLDRFSLTTKDRIRMEKYFEKIMIEFKNEPLSSCFSQIFQEMFSANTAIVWIPNNDLSKFKSTKLELEINGENSLLYAVCESKTPMIVCSLEPTAPIEILIKDPKSPQLIFPLYFSNNKIVCVIEVIRHISSNSFDDIDIRYANFIMEKFMIYGTNFIHSSEVIDFNLQFCNIKDISNILSAFKDTLQTSFDASVCEFWIKRNNTAYKFVNTEFIPVEKQNVGVINESLRTEESLLVKTARFHPCFSFKGDTSADSSVICVPKKANENVTFLTVIRKIAKQPPFEKSDLYKLELASPFILRSFNMSGDMDPNNQDANSLTSRIRELLSTVDSLFLAKDVKDSILKNAISLCHCQNSSFQEIKDKNNAIFPLYDDSLNISGKVSISSETELTNDDLKIAKAWSVFSSLRLQKEELYHMLMNFVDLLFTDHCNNVIDYLTVLKKQTKSKKVTLFVKSVFDNNLIQGLCVGNDESCSTQYAQECLEEQKQKCFILEKNERKQLVIDGNENDYIHLYDRYIISTPIGNSSVVEIELEDIASNAKIAIYEDISSFVTNLIRIHCGSEIAMIGDERYLISNYITQDEGKSYEIPENIKIDDVFSNTFCLKSLDNIGLIRVCFEIFAKFNLQQEMKINSLSLIKFLYRASLRSSIAENKDFKHSVEAALFIAKVIIASNLNFTKLQILCLLIATLCHDLDSERVSEKYTSKASIAITVLRTKVSILENLSVDVFLKLSKNCPIFPSNCSEEAEKMVKTLILCTSAAKHFDYMKYIDDEITKTTFDENQLPYMLLLIKCSDYSIYTKEWNELESQIPTIGDEFYESGDLTLIPPIQYKIFSKQREYIDKVASADVFFFNVVQPMFELAQKMIPGFDSFYENVQNNGAELAKRKPDPSIT